VTKCRSTPNLLAALRPVFAERREEEQPVLARDHTAARASRLLLAVGLDLGELPACAAESAQCGEELSAAREAVLGEWSGLPVSIRVSQ
jgi:hypothetical protein